MLAKAIFLTIALQSPAKANHVITSFSFAHEIGLVFCMFRSMDGATPNAVKTQ